MTNMARDFAIDAERPASERSASDCPECGAGWAQDHAPDCALRPVLRYEDYLRELRASRPEDYWGKYVEYLSYQ